MIVLLERIPHLHLQSWVLHGLDVKSRHGLAGGQLLGLLLEGSNVGISFKGRDEVLESLARLLLHLDADLNALVDEVSNLDEVLLEEAAGGQGRGADADTSRHQGAGVASNGVLVESDGRQLEDLLGLGPGEAVRAKVEEDEMVLSAVGDQSVSVLHEALGHGLSVLADLLGVVLELGGVDLLEGNTQGSDGVVVRSTLERREDSLVDVGLKVVVLSSLGVLAPPEEDDARARTAERLVGRGGDNVGQGKG
mmetsp:Transcript_17746/g.58389  ORF Transcript_17746/g.58389 Transcript_17746/m.58389 type:complete len:251 (+) Transcript_17746:4939-5691(+)